MTYTARPLYSGHDRTHIAFILLAAALLWLAFSLPAFAQDNNEAQASSATSIDDSTAINAEPNQPITADETETDQNTAPTSDGFIHIERVVSPRGIQAWLVEDKSVPVIAMSFAFRGAGAVLEPTEKQGTSRLLSNMLDEGAGDLPSKDFQDALNDLSISLSFQSSRDHFYGSLKTLTRNKDRAFELLHLALTEPRFDDEPLSRMKNANQSRIRSSLSDPDWIAARLINDLAFEGHPYAQNSGGTLSTLNNLTVDDLKGFLNQHLTKDRLRIAVTGDITADELGAVLDRVFAELPEAADPVQIPNIRLKNQGVTALYEKDIPQTVIQIIQPGIARSSPDFHAAQIMNYILGSSGFGSRLMEQARERRGLTYGIYTGLSTMDYVNTIQVSTSTANNNAAALLEVIAEEWNKMRSYPVSEEELADAKAYLIGSLPLSLTSTDKISSLLLSLQLDDLKINYLDERQQAIENATLDDVFRVSQKLLDPDKFTTVLVGQPGSIQPTRTITDLPNVE